MTIRRRLFKLFIWLHFHYVHLEIHLQMALMTERQRREYLKRRLAASAAKVTANPDMPSELRELAQDAYFVTVEAIDTAPIQH